MGEKLRQTPRGLMRRFGIGLQGLPGELAEVEVPADCGAEAAIDLFIAEERASGVTRRAEDLRAFEVGWDHVASARHRIPGIHVPFNADKPAEIPVLSGGMPCHLCGGKMGEIPATELPEGFKKPTHYVVCYARCVNDPKHIVGWAPWGG